MSEQPYTAKQLDRKWIVCANGYEFLICESEGEALNAIELALAMATEGTPLLPCLWSRFFFRYRITRAVRSGTENLRRPKGADRAVWRPDRLYPVTS